MNWIEFLNGLATRAELFAWAMFWQSSLLIALVFAIDWLGRDRLRPAVRYGLWLLVMLKLLLPPSLALPSSAAWWLRDRPAPVQPAPAVTPRIVYGPAEPLILSTLSEPIIEEMPRVSAAAWGLAGWAAGAAALCLVMLARGAGVARLIRRAEAAPEWAAALLRQTCELAGVKRTVRLRVLAVDCSPALCGLWRPTILVPRKLLDSVSQESLRAVFVHELMHLRRRDLWVNCAQALLQVVYWWQPLLWLANARTRRVREEAVDDAVLFTLRGEAETYAPTLLEVARLAARRPMSTLGLMGILESGQSLRRRIERLLNGPAPVRKGLSLWAASMVLVFGAMALPMGERPAEAAAKPAAVTPTRPAEPGTTGQRLQDARLLFQMGKLKEAEQAVNEVLEVEPANPAATRLGEMIRSLKAQRVESRDNLAQVPNSETNSPGRAAILAKLNSIRLGVNLENVPLREVARRLAQLTREQDPKEHGVNFLINPGRAPTNNTPGQTVPELPDVPINLGAGLKDVSLRDLLDAVVKAAPYPIKYSIEPYAVVFSWHSTPSLYTRMIKVDPILVVQGLEQVMGRELPKTMPERGPALGRLLRDFFASCGVSLDPPKTIFFNDRDGHLILRATLQDLDIIETVLVSLNTAPPQLVLQAKLFTVPDDVKTKIAELAAPTNSPTNAGSAFSGRLGPEQARNLLATLAAAPGVALLHEASVTTLSGRQTQIQFVELRPVASLNPQALTPPGVSTVADVYASTQVPVGPSLDITAAVGADERKIQLTVTANLNEMLGYETPAEGASAVVVETLGEGAPPPGGTAYVNGQVRSVSIPLPRLRNQSVTTSAILPDGASFVIGGLTTTSSLLTKDQVPVLGDLPLLGRLFRNESTQTVTKHVVILLTPTVIDPAGNPVRE